MSHYKPHSVTTKLKMSKIHKSPELVNVSLKNLPKNCKGSLNGNWKGGKSSYTARKRSSQKYKQWRMAVFSRDNFTCQFCGKRGYSLEAHHIKKWSIYPKLRFVLDNGVTLCVECHNLTKKINKVI